MNPVVTIEMESGGVITAELYPQQALSPFLISSP